jgi:hypothetical protein
MRTALFGALVAACLAATPLTSKPANALALTAPAGMAAAADALSETQKVTYGYGWGYRPWRPYYRPIYYGYRPWRPYYRPAYYGHRPWRPYYRPVYYGYRPYYRPAYYGYRPWRPYYRPAFVGPRFYGGWGYRRWGW